MLCALRNLLPFLLLVPLTTLAEPLHVVTEELPPYSFSRDGHIEGLSTDIVRATLEQANIDYDIEMTTWAKAYSSARFKPYTLIYSVAKTPQRLTHFRWIGEIVSFESCLFSLQENTHPRLNTLKDALNYRVGATFGGGGEQALINQGFELGKNLIRSPSERALKTALRNGSIDFWIALKPTAMGESSEDKLADQPAFRQHICLPPGEGLYMALSKNTPNEIGNKLIQSLQSIKASGEYQTILNRYQSDQI